MNYFSNDTIEIVTHIAVIAFSCFTIYKTIQFIYNPGTFNDNSDIGTVSGSPTIKPESLSSVNSVDSTISSNTTPIPIPDPSPLNVPSTESSNTVIHVYDRVVDGSSYLFAILGDPAQTGVTEILNVFM
jgi:hypothetical protein